MEIRSLFSLTEYIHRKVFFTVSLQSPCINSMANSTGTKRFSCMRRAQSTRHFLSAVYLVRLRVFVFWFFFFSLIAHLGTRNSDLLFFQWRRMTYFTVHKMQTFTLRNYPLYRRNLESKASRQKWQRKTLANLRDASYSARSSRLPCANHHL